MIDDRTTKEIDFDPKTATVAQWRRAYETVTDPEHKKLCEIWLLMADAYGFAEDSVLWPQAEDLINSHSRRGNN
jgi:hypothetical protein